MKKVIVLLTIFLLLSISIAGASISSSSINRSFLKKQIDFLHPLSRIRQQINGRFQNNQVRASNGYGDGINNTLHGFAFSPQDIELKDDAFHGALTLHFTEWWYFDAAFDNGYSAQMSVRVLGAMNQGVVFSRLAIYKHGILVSHRQKLYFMKDFYAPSDVPLIRLAGKEVMKGHIDDFTGDWVYDLSFETKDASADLHFVGCTEGWKGQLHGGDWWGVILPRAEVTGKIKVNQNEIDVNGIGYHDHNWEVTVFAGVNFGWFWGKINSDSYTMTWSNILTTRITHLPILVINKKNDSYFNVKSEDIQFIAREFGIKNGMIIPYSFTLNAYNEYISLHVDMEVLAVHHVRLMGIINYWRYHVRCTGSIIVGTREENIDGILMTEFIRFR